MLLATLAVFALPLHLVAADETQTEPAAASCLRVATFNINWGNLDLPDIERTLREAAADLVFIQECNAKSESFFRRRLRKLYPHMKFRGDRGRYGAERFGFLSNRKLTDLRFTPARHGLFGIYQASLRLDDQQVQLINVHLSPFVIPRNATAAQAMTALARVEGIHQQETQQLVGLIDRNTPTLVCGDFNSLSTFTAPQRLTRLDFIDSFASVTEQPNMTPTWRWPVGRLKIQFRIDYIFHSPHFRTTKSRVINTTGSDHSVVVSELQLTPPGM